VKPFSIAALAWFFIGHVFRLWLPADQINSYIAGLILFAAAPCTATVFVWSSLMKGEPHFTLSPSRAQRHHPGVRLRANRRSAARPVRPAVPWDTLVLSDALYIVIPVIVSQGLRGYVLGSGGESALARLLERLGSVSLVSLLATLVLLFGFQGEQILAQPMVIGMLAVPILIQVYFNAGVAYLLNRLAGEQHCVAGPSALIGASNFFELAVAAAISLFGFSSGAALATVVGVLIEVRSCVCGVDRQQHPRLVRASTGDGRRIRPPLAMTGGERMSASGHFAADLRVDDELRGEPLRSDEIEAFRFALVAAGLPADDILAAGVQPFRAYFEGLGFEVVDRT
jgi:arsenical-resistance protein